MDRDINQVAPSFFSMKKFLSLAFYGKLPSGSQCKSILKTLLFWREAPANEIYKSMTLKASFIELTSNPVRLVNRIYRFVDLEINNEYKEQLRREAQEAKNYKSKHRYSALAIDFNALNKE